MPIEPEEAVQAAHFGRVEVLVEVSPQVACRRYNSAEYMTVDAPIPMFAVVGAVMLMVVAPVVAP